MKMRKLGLLALSFVVIMTLGAVVPPQIFDASDQEELELSAYRSYRGGKREFNAEKMGARVQKSLNTAVKFGAYKLMRKGDVRGQRMLTEWEMKYYEVFLKVEIGSLDVGDHEAIAWLLNFYTTVESVLGRSIMESTHLRDIWTLAYAIPVVFQPARSDIDMEEYALHFVPFSKSIGFWMIMGGCTAYQWIGTPATTLICDPIAEAGRFAFGIIGDPLGKEIWRSAHRI